MNGEFHPPNVPMFALGVFLAIMFVACTISLFFKNKSTKKRILGGGVLLYVAAFVVFAIVVQVFLRGLMQ